MTFIRYIICFGSAALAMTIPFKEKHEEIEKCAAEVLDIYEEPYAVIIDASNGFAINNIVAHIRNISYVLMNLEILETVVIQWRPNLYFILTSTVENYKIFLHLFYRTDAWNPRATFFVVYLGNEDTIKLVQLSWKYYTLRTYILDKTLKVQTYFPFQSEKCGEPLEAEVVYQCGNRQFLTQNLTHTSNLPIKFNNCPFRVEALKVVPYVISTYGEGERGFEVQILEQIANYSNISLIFLNHTHETWGFRDATHYDNMFKDILDKKTDAIAGMVTPSAPSRLFDKTIVHGFDTSKYFVPAGKQIVAWKHFLMIFDYKVWILVLVIINVTSMALWGGGMLTHTPEGYDRLDYCLLQILRATVSVIPRLPRALYFRCITFLWFSSVIILSTTYQSKLLTFLVKPAFEEEITSFKQLVESNLILKGHYTELRLMQHSEPEVYRKVLHRWENCTLASLNCTIQTIENRDSAFAQSERITNYLVQKYYGDKNKKSKLKGLNDKVYSYKVCFYLDLGSPYYERFNNIISRLAESGLIEKWVVYLETTQPRISADEFIRLNIYHLLLAFQILAIGQILAFCVFLAELCYHRVTHTRDRKLQP